MKTKSLLMAGALLGAAVLISSKSNASSISVGYQQPGLRVNVALGHAALSHSRVTKVIKVVPQTRVVVQPHPWRHYRHTKHKHSKWSQAGHKGHGYHRYFSHRHQDKQRLAAKVLPSHRNDIKREYSSYKSHKR